MVGDGYTAVRHCEYVDPEPWLEPDADPQYCTLNESEPDKVCYNCGEQVFYLYDDCLCDRCTFQEDI